MISGWMKDYFQELDTGKRQVMLTEHVGELSGETGELLESLWQARFGKKRPKNDAFVGALMELKFMAESGSDIGGKKKKDAADIVSRLYLFEVDKRPEYEQELIAAELTNAFLHFISVSKGGRGFTSLVFGMGQLSDEGVAKKVAEQISTIAFKAPHMLHMDREFACLQQAALLAFRQEYPDREHLLTK